MNAQAPLRTTRAPDHDISYLAVHTFQSKDRTPVVIMPGMGCSPTSHPDLVDIWARERRVYVLDPRPSPNRSFSIPNVASDIEHVMRAESIKRAHLIGISMGGFIAQEFAHTHPHRIASLSLVSTCRRPIEALTQNGQSAVSLLPDFLRLLGPRANQAYLKLSSQLLFGAPTCPSARKRFFRRRKCVPVPSGLDLVQQLLAVLTWTPPESLHALRAPALAIGGADDKVVPANLVNTAVDGARRGFTHLLPGGHACYAEFPIEFERAWRRHCEVSDRPSRVTGSAGAARL